MALVEQGCWTRWTPEFPTNLTHSVSLWYHLVERNKGKKRQTSISASFFSLLEKVELGLVALQEEWKGKQRTDVRACVCLPEREQKCWDVSTRCLPSVGKTRVKSEEPAWAQHRARTVSTESTRRACPRAQRQHLSGQINLAEPHQKDVPRSQLSG